jgi:hypothetical protein
MSTGDQWRLPTLYQQWLDDPNTGNGGDGSYVLNSVPYYRKDGGTQGKLRGPGAAGGWDGWYNARFGSEPHISALIMCLTSYQPLDFGLTAHAHQLKGVNCTYIDGHTQWLPIAPDLWRYQSFSDRWGTGTGLMGAGGFWPWASHMSR